MEAALIVFTFNNLTELIMSRAMMYEPNAFTEEEFVKALRTAKKHMKKHFGSLRVRLGDVQKHVRGHKVIGVGGAPDVLASNMSKPYKKGMLKTFVGESYIMLVDFDENGKPRIETINAFGASNKPESPHYSDQMELWSQQKTKPMTLDKDEVYKSAEKVYHPR
jgi:acyl-homoserine-lactone acylase